MGKRDSTKRLSVKRSLTNSEQWFHQKIITEPRSSAEGASWDSIQIKLGPICRNRNAESMNGQVRPWIYRCRPMLENGLDLNKPTHICPCMAYYLHMQIGYPLFFGSSQKCRANAACMQAAYERMQPAFAGMQVACRLHACCIRSNATCIRSYASCMQAACSLHAAYMQAACIRSLNTANSVCKIGFT